MKKLIELLNEYELGKDNYSGVISEGDIYYYSVLYISKEYGFIKWLVENEKIDLEIVKEKIGIPCFVWYTEGEISCVNDKEDYEQLLMILSIQDEPIEFLISILKNV